MSEENLPVWKQAAKDSQHPLHKATWLLFAEKFNPKFASQQLADKKEETIEYIYLILDTDELYYEESFGSGYAPANSARLLGQWQVTEAIPRLMKLIIEEDEDAIVWNGAMLAMENMGQAAIEPIFNALESGDIESFTAVSILADAGRGDTRTYEFLRTEFEKQKDEWDIRFLAEFLLSCDAEKAIPYLEERLKKVKYPEELRAILESYIQDAKEGNFP